MRRSAAKCVEVNQSIVDEPALVNSDPMGKGWFVKMKIKDRSQIDALMSDEDYQARRLRNPFTEIFP